MEDKITKVTKFVEKHTDEQCGLDVAFADVFDQFGEIRIIISSKTKNWHHKRKKGSNKGMRKEWLAQAEDLIEEIGGDPGAGYGGLGIDFELHSVSDSSFELREKEE